MRDSRLMARQRLVWEKYAAGSDGGGGLCGRWAGWRRTIAMHAFDARRGWQRRSVVVGRAGVGDGCGVGE